jgi:hypothetical protein
VDLSSTTLWQPSHYTTIFGQLEQKWYMVDLLKNFWMIDLSGNFSFTSKFSNILGPCTQSQSYSRDSFTGLIYTGCSFPKTFAAFKIETNFSEITVVDILNKTSINVNNLFYLFVEDSVAYYTNTFTLEFKGYNVQNGKLVYNGTLLTTPISSSTVYMLQDVSYCKKLGDHKIEWIIGSQTINITFTFGLKINGWGAIGFNSANLTMKNASIVMGYTNNVNEYFTNDFVQPTLQNSKLQSSSFSHPNTTVLKFVRKLSDVADSKYFSIRNELNRVLIAYNEISEPSNPSTFTKHTNAKFFEINWYTESQCSSPVVSPKFSPKYSPMISPKRSMFASPKYSPNTSQKISPKFSLKSSNSTISSGSSKNLFSNLIVTICVLLLIL